MSLVYFTRTIHIRFIRVVHVSIVCSFLLLCGIPLHGYTTAESHLGCFQLLTITNKVTINIPIQVSV